MVALLYAGTDDGLHAFRVGCGEIERVGSALAESAVREVAVDPDDPQTAYAACGYGGHGVYRIADAGRTATSLGLEDRWCWGVAVSPANRLLVGTEPPEVYRSDDGGATLEPSADVPALAADADWFFWYEPHEAGHVHGFGVHPDRPGRVLAGVEVGGALRSDDGGRGWEPIGDLDGRDVHAVAPDPDDPDRWYAAAGEGLFGSTDGGDSWTVVEPLAATYVADLTFDAAGRLCVSAAPNSRAEEATFWRREGPEDWRALDVASANSLAGVPAVHPTDPDVLFHTESTTDSCRLRVSRDGGETWRAVGPGLARVRTLAVSAPT